MDGTAVAIALKAMGERAGLVADGQVAGVFLPGAVTPAVGGPTVTSLTLTAWRLVPAATNTATPDVPLCGDPGVIRQLL